MAQRGSRPSRWTRYEGGIELGLRLRARREVIRERPERRPRVSSRPENEGCLLAENGDDLHGTVS